MPPPNHDLWESPSALEAHGGVASSNMREEQIVAGLQRIEAKQAEQDTKFDAVIGVLPMFYRNAIRKALSNGRQDGPPDSDRTADPVIRRGPTLAKLIGPKS